MKFYPSSSAFMVGDTVITKYNSGCLRSIMLKANGVETEEIADLYKECGEAAETQHAADLTAKGVQFVREFKVNAQLSPNVEYSGRLDFLCHMKVGTVVDETKGHTSKNTRREVIRGGEYNVSYLAQLVSYMSRLRTTRGRLVCGYYERDPDTQALVRQEERTFHVEIDDTGSIDVDGSPSGFCVADLLAHQRAAVHAIESKTIEARPDKWSQKYGGPCTFCPFKDACDAYDTTGGTPEEFIAAAQRCVAQAVPRPEPKAFYMKKPKPPKTPKQPKTSKKGAKYHGKDD